MHLKKRSANRPIQLATRLSWWYAVSSFLLVLVVTGFLYLILIRNFQQQNDRYLEGKANVLQTLLRDVADPDATVKWEVDEELAEDPSIRILSRVLSESGRTLFETEGMSRELPVSLFSATESTRGQEVRSATRKIFRTMVVAATNRSGQKRYRIAVAIDMRYQNDLLSRYRNELWLALAAGLLISIFVGHRIAHRGLKPLADMAAAVQRIRSNTLNERIKLKDSPAEVHTLAMSFNKTLDRLQDAFDRLSRFSSDIAHELRTPINNIRGQMEVALSRVRDPAEYAEVLEICLEDCERLSRLIDSLLFLARAEHPEAEIRRENLDLQRELKTLAEFYEPAAAERGVRLDVRVPNQLNARLDRALFQRAIGNLVENSLRYTPAGGHVTIEAEARSDRLALSVSDDGNGISEQHLNRVFDRFYRVDAARASTGSQSGLGLAIVQTIARLHGGEVEIESAVGKGTSVTLVL
jgi:two-component system, OmpR family, heavy metal sensor histidine kinase CusS